jgi:hypothetical protein
MQFPQNAIKHPSQTSSLNGILAILSRMDDRSAAGQCRQITQSPSPTGSRSTISTLIVNA